MGQLLSEVASHLSPPGDTAGTSQPSYPAIHQYLPQYFSSTLNCVVSLHTLQQRVRSRQSVRLCEVWRSGYLRLRIRRSQFREESQSASEPPFLSNKTGKPGLAVVQVVAGGVGGLAGGWCADPGPVKMCPIFPRAAGGGGDWECNALSCYNDHNTTTTTTTNHLQSTAFQTKQSHSSVYLI